MANTKSAAKRARQTTRRSLRNRSVLTRLRRMQKHAGGSNAASNASEIRLLISAIDKAAKRGIIHKNAANRRKARLNELLKSSAAKPAGA
jgi:small subunit ribosomal protein S20